MTAREYAKAQIDALPEQAVAKVVEFIAFQRFSMGFENDTDYLLSIPGMLDKIETASSQPTSQGVSASQLWTDV